MDVMEDIDLGTRELATWNAVRDRKADIHNPIPRLLVVGDMFFKCIAVRENMWFRSSIAIKDVYVGSFGVRDEGRISLKRSDCLVIPDIKLTRREVHH